MLPKKRGRTSRVPTPKLATVRRNFYNRLRPTFLEFVCEWAGCNARLYNADTLVAHVEIVHGERQRGGEDGQRVCLWRGCGNPEGHTAANGTVRTHAAKGDGVGQAMTTMMQQQLLLQPTAMVVNEVVDEKEPALRPWTFATLEDFIGHMHSEHLDYVRRVMGNGPATQVLGQGYAVPDVSRYLTDSNGRLLMPLMGDLEDEIEDEATRRTRKAALRRLLQQKDDNAPFEYDLDSDVEELAANLMG
jgi:hypothetical protein